MVENNIELIDEENKNDPEFANFVENNKFCRGFKTSDKKGINISESMEFLIKNIIKRMEDFSQKGTEIFIPDRKTVSLDPQKYNEAPTSKRAKKGGC